MGGVRRNAAKKKIPRTIGAEEEELRLSVQVHEPLLYTWTLPGNEQVDDGLGHRRKLSLQCQLV